jgi:gliding motility-associated-like protein/uncharacterized repeat protein (TIGR01451 family)
VWIKKKYKPKLNGSISGSSVSETSANTGACTRKYAITGLPYVLDIAETGNAVDTVQIHEVVRHITPLNVGEASKLQPLIYNSKWAKEILQDTFSLTEGQAYRVKYAYRYKYAHADSVTYDSVTIQAPYYIKTCHDAAGVNGEVLSGVAKAIDVLTNDTISKCLLDKKSFVVEVLEKHGSGQYAAFGASFRGGALSVADNKVAYTSAPDFQGIDTFVYQVKDTTAYGMQQTNAKVDTVIVRVEPVYEFSVSKAVDSVVNRKGVRYTGSDPNLDSLFVGDTAYFTVRVKNTGNNSITDSITVTDTLPARFDTVATCGAAMVATRTLRWKVAGSDTNQDTLGVGEEKSITYALVARDTAISPPDTNRVHITAKLPKNTFDSADSITPTHNDALLLRVYESVDVAFTQQIDTSGGSFTLPFVDTLRCDSLYQRAAFVLTVRNVGSAPFSSVTIVDTLSAGMSFSDTAYYIADEKGNVAPLTGVSLNKAPNAADTVYTWEFTGVHVGPDSALLVVFGATVSKLGVFGSRGSAFVPGKMDVDSTDNYSAAATVIFQPEIKFEVKKKWEKYPNGGDYIGLNSILKVDITVTNKSALPLRNVEVRDTLWTPYVCKTTTPGNAIAIEKWYDDTLVWTIDHLDTEESKTLNFYVKASHETDFLGGDPSIPDSVNNTAYAYLPLYYGYDSVYSSSSHYVYIRSGIDLEVTASIIWPDNGVKDTFSQQQGDTVRLMLKVKNNSEQEAVTQKITVQVVFPDSMLAYSSSVVTPGDSYDPETGRWYITGNTLPKIDTGGSDSIIITLITMPDTGYVSKKAMYGYIYQTPYTYQPECASCVRNDTTYTSPHAPTLYIRENAVDLSVTKKVTDVVYLSGGGGETITDTIVVSTYKNPISNITLADSLPAGVSNVELIASEALKKVLEVRKWSDGGATRYVVATKAGASISLSGQADTTIVVSYKASKDGKYPSVVRVACSSVEATLRNNVARDTTDARPKVDLQVTFTAQANHPQLATQGEVIEGDTITYTLVVSHNLQTSSAAATATDVTLTIDPITDYIVFISAAHLSDKTATPAIDASSGIKFDKISVPYGEKETIEVLARVKPNAGGNAIQWRAYLSCKTDLWHENDTTKANALTAVNNPNDASVSITPVDTFFHLSEANGAERTPKFTDSIRVKNSGTENLKSITVKYYYKYPELIYETPLTPEPKRMSIQDGQGVVEWEFGSMAPGKDTVIAISGCDIPYHVAGRYTRSVAVFAGVLEADPTNNTAEATASVVYDADLKVDSLQLLLRKSVSASYTQGDTIAVSVKLSNRHGNKNGHNVQVWVTDTSGFKALDANPHKLPALLAPGGALYDTLRFVIDTFTAPGASLRLRVAARADTSASAFTFTVRDTSLSKPFTVSKGADAKVWLDTVHHEKVYYANLSYAIAVTNLDQYKATGVALHHVVPGAFSIDSVCIQNKSAKDTTLVAPLSSVWSLGTVAPNAKDTVRITFYVTSDSSTATLPIAGYIACDNDNYANNDTIDVEVNVERFKDSLKVAKNPYHLKVTKTTTSPPCSSITDTIIYTVEVKNIGDSTAYGLVVTDTLPSTIAQRGAATSGNKNVTVQKSADTIVWRIDTLPPDSSCTLTFKAVAYEAGAVRNAAQIVSFDNTAEHPFDPDPKNRKDQACIDTTDVASDQRIAISSVVYKPVGNGLGVGWAPADTFTQGDTMHLTVTVAKTNPNEKALGIRIALDTTFWRSSENFERVWYAADGEHCLGSAFDDTTLVWTLDLDTSPQAAGTLNVYAVIGSKIPAKGAWLDSLKLHVDVRDTSKYYPKINIGEERLRKIYVAYCDLDLEVRVQVGKTEHPTNPKAVYPDAPFSYYIHIVNLRDALAEGDSVTLTDTLPYGIKFDVKNVTPVRPDTSYAADGGRTVLRWNNLKPYLDGVKNGSFKQLVLQGCRGSSYGYYPNKAQIAVNRHEATLSNNSGADTACVVSPLDFELAFVTPRDTVTQGDQQELTLTITNRSESTQSNLIVATASIPPQLSFIKSDRGEYSSETQAFTWSSDAENLPPNGSIAITITVEAIDTGAVAWPATLSAGADEVQVAEDTVKIYVGKNPYNVKLTKTADKSVFFRDEAAPYTFSYTIRVANTGEQPVGNIIVRDTLPAGIDTVMPDFAISCPSAQVETLDDGRIAIAFATISNLYPTQTKQVTFKCRVEDAGAAASFLNRASLTSAAHEASRDDNADTALVEVRNVVNLKVQVALCRQDGTAYPSDHKYLQGEEVYVNVSVVNNGKQLALQTFVTITSSHASLGSFAFEPNPASYLGTANKSYKISTGECGNFTISAVAATTVDFPQGAPLPIKDSAAVTFSILPNADMSVKVTVAPPATSHSTSRAYTILLENKGQYRADTVVLRHTLDPLIISLDSIRVEKLFGALSDSLTSIPIPAENVQYEAAGNEIFAYSHANRTLTYGIDGVEAGSAAAIVLFVTTAKPPTDTVLKIYPYAEVSVFDNRDKKLSNNSASSETPIEVHPNPYNVSVSITPKREDRRYVNPEGDMPLEYTIIAKNIGKLPAEGLVHYDASSGLVITEHHTPDNIESTSDASATWTIPQLHGGTSMEFRLTVAPSDLSSKGSKLSIVRIVPEFTKTNDPQVTLETDLYDNADTAYLNLFSMLQSWTLMEAFSPNGDGKNDKFVINDLDANIVDRAEIVIVNRYGSEVYYNRNYKEAQLDDNIAFTGAGLPEGSYFYQLTVYFIDNSVDKRGGIITIRRSRWK